MSMGEIIDHIAQDTQSKEYEDARKRYKGVCPVCGKENWICKSIAMEMGINTGHGACLGCKTFLHITFNPERQERQRHRGSLSELRLASRKIKRCHRQNGCGISLNFPRHTVARYF